MFHGNQIKNKPFDQNNNQYNQPDSTRNHPIWNLINNKWFNNK